MKPYSKELERMQNLMTYGMVNEGTHNSSNAILEYHATAADGKTYGIIKECNKFYIKVAPNKDTEVLAEDYSYIGGEMNKKENEYTSYAAASKNFELKMMSINEACNSKKPIVTQFKPQETAEWQINETKEMRQELNRYNQIVNNVDAILNESEGFTVNHTLPEAPAKNPSDSKVNAPFTDTAVANGDKDFTKTATDPKKQGGPYVKDGKASNSDMQSDKNHTGEGDTVFTENPKYAPSGSVANEHPSGAKAVKMNEHRTVKLTEEQVLAWNASKDFMDTSKGTEIGDSAPYVDEVNESEDTFLDNGTDQNTPAVGAQDPDVSEPYIEIVTEMEVAADDIAGLDDDEVPFPEVEESNGAYLDFEQDYNDWLDDNEGDEFELDSDDEEGFDGDEIDLDYAEYANESKVRPSRRINEWQINDYAKHPAWQKQAMTTPPNREISRWGRDWNDESAANEKPYGISKGNPAPYDEKVVDMLTDAIMDSMFKKKL